MENTTHASVPRHMVCSFVDDLVVRLEGSERSVARGLADAVECCLVGINEDALIASSGKSVVVSSRVDVARKVVSLLRVRDSSCKLHGMQMISALMLLVADGGVPKS